MYPDFLNDPSFYRKLAEIDLEACENIKEKNCQFCGSKLDRGTYSRKPRGVPACAEGLLDQRYSLCCRKVGCRKRHLPHSVVYFGRRSWLACFFAIASILAGASSPESTKCFLEKTGLTPRQLKRWRRWWNEDFRKSLRWKRLRGFVVVPHLADLPDSLFDAFKMQDLNFSDVGLIQLLNAIKGG